MWPHSKYRAVEIDHSEPTSVLVSKDFCCFRVSKRVTHLIDFQLEVGNLKVFYALDYLIRYGVLFTFTNFSGLSAIYSKPNNLFKIRMSIMITKSLDLMYPRETPVKGKRTIEQYNRSCKSRLFYFKDKFTVKNHLSIVKPSSH